MAEEDDVDVAAYESRRASMVHFPRRSEDASLKMSSVDSQETSVTKLWQVYLLGGVMIARWAWARWKERTSRGQA